MTSFAVLDSFIVYVENSQFLAKTLRKHINVFLYKCMFTFEYQQYCWLTLNHSMVFKSSEGQCRLLLITEFTTHRFFICKLRWFQISLTI